MVQRQPGGDGDAGLHICSQPPRDRRCIRDGLHLEAGFWGADAAPSSRLDDAFHNDAPLTRADNGPGGPVAKFQAALIQVGEDLGPLGADGDWGGKTSGAVASFQSKNGIQPGGFEAGRKTLLALDSHLTTVAPPQNRVPVLHLSPECGAEAGQAQDGAPSTQTIQVEGDDFTAGAAVVIQFDDVAEFHAQPDDRGHFARTIEVSQPADGAHTVGAFDFAAGQTERATAAFNVPCPVNPSDPTQLNPALELVLDQIPIAIERVMFNRLTGLTDLERDLENDPEKQGNLGTVGLALVKFAAERAIEFVFNAHLSRVLAQITKDLGVSSPDLVKDPSLSAQDVFSELQNIALDAEKNFYKVADLPIGTTDPEAIKKEVRAYVDGERTAVLQGTESAQQKFVTTEKPRLRSMKTTPKSATDDPRVTAAKAYLDAVEQIQDTAAKDQYDKSVEQWSVSKARAQFGTTKNEFGQPVGTDLTGVGESPLFGQQPGLFKIKVHAGSPADLTPDPVRIAVTGLTEQVRGRMTKDDTPLSALGARAILVIDGSGLHVLVSKNEAGEVFVNSTSDDAKKWLRDHDSAAEPGTTPTEKGGALSLFDEIEGGTKNSVGKVPGGLQTGGFFS
jgi:hypothetical protein